MRFYILFFGLFIFSSAKAQTLTEKVIKEFPLISLPYTTPKNLPFEDKVSTPDLSKFSYVGNDVTELLKKLLIFVEKDSKCYAVGRIKCGETEFLIYLEVEINNETPKHQYYLKVSAKWKNDEKSVFKLGNKYLYERIHDDDKLYKQEDNLKSTIYIKDDKLYIDSKIRLIDDLIVNDKGKLKRTKNTVYKYRDRWDGKEFVEQKLY